MKRRGEDAFDIALVAFTLVFIVGAGLILGTCRPAWPATPYVPGGPAVRVYDGGTGAHDAATARRNLGIGTGTLVGFRDSLSTLSYTALLNPQIHVLDSQLWIKDNGDTTKRFQFEASGIATGTLRTYTVKNANGTLPLLETANTFTARQDITPTSDVMGLSINVPSGNANYPFQVFQTDNGIPAFAVDATGNNFVYGVLDLVDPAAGGIVTVQRKSSSALNKTYRIDNSIATLCDFVMTSGAQTIANVKTFTGANIHSGACQIQGATTLFCDGTTARVRWVDQADNTKQSAPNVSQITTATTRVDTIPDYSGQRVVRINARDFVGQTANIGSTTICSSPPAGMYRVTVYGEVTGLLGGAVTVTLGWTDPQQAQTATSTFGLAAGSYVTMTTPMRVASGNITLASSGYVSGTYSVYSRVEVLP